MDFNKIVNMMREIEPTDIANPNAEAPKTDTTPEVILSEAAQLRVKAGISTVLAESKKIQDSSVDRSVEEGKMPQAAIDALAKKKGKSPSLEFAK